MLWAKTQQRARYTLATSGVGAFPLGLLPVRMEDLEINGDSMMPVYRDGDVVVVSPQAQIRRNDRVVLKTVEGTIRNLSIKTDSPDKLARLLSGGNQQKIVIGKWLARGPRLLILDEPTIRVDIGAKSEIVATVRRMADTGMAVLLISSELEELMAISDRILVLHNGRIIQNMNRRNLSSEEELHHAIQGHRIKHQASDVAA